MDKQILKAVEEAYRQGLRDGNYAEDISPYLITSQVISHEIANKFCNKSDCLCLPDKGEEIGWVQKRHCNRCDKVIDDL